MSTQTKHKGTAQRTRKYIPEGAARIGTIQRRRPSGAYSTAFGCVGLPALKLKSKMAFDVDEKILQGYDKNKIYTDIETISRNYFRLCRKKFIAPNPELPLSNRIMKLYDGMKALLHKEFPKVNLSLHKDEQGNSYFEAYYHYRMHDYTVYALPLQILDIFYNRDNPLYEYLLGIYGMIMSYPEFTDWQNEGHYDYIATEMIMEQANEVSYDDEESAGRMINDSSYYQRGGKANYWLNKIYGMRLSDYQVRALRKLKVQPEEAFLKQWIINGYELLSSKNRQKVASLRNEEEFEPNEDCDPVSLQRLFIMCWNNDDEIVSAYIESIQMEAQEFGSYSPMEVFRPDKATKPYKHNNWFDLFLEWINPGTVAITSICERENKKKDADGEPDRED